MPSPHTIETRYIADWTEAMARELSAKENLRLSDAHWRILRLARAFYQKHQLVPNNRVLVKLLRAKSPSEAVNSHTLMQLFDPADPAAQAARIAGLPSKPCLSDQQAQRR